MNAPNHCQSVQKLLRCEDRPNMALRPDHRTATQMLRPSTPSRKCGCELQVDAICYRFILVCSKQNIVRVEVYLADRRIDIRVVIENV